MSFDPAAVRAFEHAGWERAAGAYDATFAQASRQFVEPLLDAAAVGPAQPVLDLCCGTGVATAAAARRGSSAVGLDFSAAMLAAARRANPKLRFDEGEVEALPYENGAFAAVIANFGMHHAPEPARAAAEAYRVVQPGGRFAFTTWAAPSENIAWRLLFDAIRAHGDPDAAKAPPSGGNLATAAAVSDLLRRAGFREPQIKLLRREWVVAEPQQLVAALARGTVRTAAQIAAQSEAARPAILHTLAAAAAPYRRADGTFAVPIAAILGCGAKPAR